MFRQILIFTIALVFIGCSFKPNMPNVNNDFTNSIDSSKVSNEWWKNFNDEKLNHLIIKGFKNNSTLQLASLNVEKARQTLSLRNKDFLPSITATANGNRMQNSGEIASRPPQMRIDDFSISAFLNYEVDLWGRVRNMSNAAQSIYKATKYDFDSAKITIASNIATTYFTLITFNKEQEILEDTLEAYKKTKDYQKKQFDAGAISELTYLQSVGEYESARVRLSKIKNNINLTQSALAFLVGDGLNDILYTKFVTSKTLPKAPEIPSGISSDVLLNRADVASAYEKIKSSNYLIGVAKSAYFPTLSLTGAFGYQSESLGNLFLSNANIWSLGASLAGKIFDFGRTSINVDIAKLNQDINVINYDIAVKSALTEVRNALNSRESALQTQQYLTTFLKSQNRIYELSKDMFNEGYTTQLQLLDSQRILLNAKIQNAESKLSVINSTVAIYKAFGGGFKPIKDDK